MPSEQAMEAALAEGPSTRASAAHLREVIERDFVRREEVSPETLAWAEKMANERFGIAGGS